MSRFRTFLDESDVGNTEWIKYDSDGIETTSGILTRTTKYVVARCIDTVTPNFEERKNAGELIFNEFRLESYSYRLSPIVYNSYYTYENGDPYYSYTGNSSGFPLPESPLLVSAVSTTEFDQACDKSASDLAISEAWSRVDLSEQALLAALGEAPETVKFLASGFRQFIKLTRKLLTRKGRLLLLKQAGKLSPTEYADEIANLWLAFRYGVRPLIYDARNTVKALEKSLVEGTRLTARGKANSNDADDWDQVVSGTYDKRTLHFERRVKVEASAGVLYHIQLSEIGIGEVWGLDQPFEAMWELTPFSFILDWFFNVGDVISAWTRNASCAVDGAWCTTVVTTTISASCEGFETYPSYDWYLSREMTDSGSLSMTVTRKRREILPTKPLLPDVSISLDIAKLTDLAAIARGLYKAFKH